MGVECQTASVLAGPASGSPPDTAKVGPPALECRNGRVDFEHLFFKVR